MKFLLLATAFLLAVSATPIDEWNKYKAEHKKVYTSKEENDRRLEQYLKNKEMVEEHNRKYERGETTYTMGLNQFSDWFPEEIDKMLGQKSDKNRPSGGQKFELPPGTAVPDSINWVEKGAVTSVKDQEKFASSYPFAAVGALEGLMFRSQKQTIANLSVQQLVDCSDNYGCLGRFPDYCYDYVINWGGIESDKSYPYVAKKQKCSASKEKVALTCSDYTQIYDEDQLRHAVGTVGPAAILFSAADEFLHYKNGIYNGSCHFGPNQGMVVVGYGTDNVTNNDYWLIKNSWGTKWGEKGYARVLRNVDLCEVADYASYPIY